MKPIPYDELLADVRRRKRERWLRILAAEEPGRRPGRRPRDPKQEELLLRLDRARLERRNQESERSRSKRTGDDPQRRPT